jgi:iron complex outermembrane receptor protein
MEPSNIGHLLSETPGVQTQQTSSVSGSQSFKLQGLDGKYTQILKDGFPLYSGLLSGLSLLQIPPLDLRQVEIIKGPSSALYGGDAVAGIVNLISKEPGARNSLDLLFNVNSNRGYDINGFYSGRTDKIGFTFLATRQYQQEKDGDGDGFTDIPRIDGFTVNPKLFIFIDKDTDVWLSIFSNRQERTGGYLFLDFTYLYPFTERVVTSQTYSQLKFDKRFRNKNIFTLKNSINYFSKRLTSPLYLGSETQWTTFTEISYQIRGTAMSNIFGLSSNTEWFAENEEVSRLNRDYDYRTFGAFFQNDLSVLKKFKIESGLRIDYQNKYRFFALPRISAIYKFSEMFSMRFGGGLGYKVPSIFSDESELGTYSTVLPLGDGVKAERSYGINADLTYRTTVFNSATVNFNQAYYFTRLNEPLVPIPAGGNLLEYQNADGYIRTQGLESNMRVSLYSFKLFLGYAFIDAFRMFSSRKLPVYLIPKHSIATVLVFEKEDFGKAGIEAFYTGRQRLPDGTQTQDYWVLGASAEKFFKYFNVFINFENFTDLRQSDYGPVVLPPYYYPKFKDVWAPLEGFAANGGVKIRL